MCAGGGVSVIKKTLNPLQSRRKVPSVKKVFKYGL